jgi:hypothetical protein
VSHARVSSYNLALTEASSAVTVPPTASVASSLAIDLVPVGVVRHEPLPAKPAASVGVGLAERVTWKAGLSPDRKTAEGTVNDMKKTERIGGESPSRLIDARIRELDDWRGKTLAHVRALIKQADLEVVEEWKWRGVPVWYHDGMICTGETYKSVVKLTFAKGASLKDPSGLFNASLEGNTRRAIDLREGDEVDADAFKTLIRAAVALNR